jgi:hypothetical protein
MPNQNNQTIKRREITAEKKRTLHLKETSNKQPVIGKHGIPHLFNTANDSTTIQHKPRHKNQNYMYRNSRYIIKYGISRKSAYSLQIMNMEFIDWPKFMPQFYTAPNASLRLKNEYN